MSVPSKNENGSNRDKNSLKLKKMWKKNSNKSKRTNDSDDIGHDKKKRKIEVKKENNNNNNNRNSIGTKTNGKSIKAPPIPPQPPSSKYKCTKCTKIWTGNSSDNWYYLKFKKSWICVGCGDDYTKSHACPICGLCFNEDESEDESNWIQCDYCDRWVMTRCDGISDLSKYDDTNPNPLSYGCPICSKRMKNAIPLILYKNNGKVSGSSSSSTEDEVSDDNKESSKDVKSSVKEKPNNNKSNNKDNSNNNVINEVVKTPTKTKDKPKIIKKDEIKKDEIKKDEIKEKDIKIEEKIVVMNDIPLTNECYIKKLEKELMDEHEKRSIVYNEDMRLVNTDKTDKIEKIETLGKLFRDDISRLSDLLIKTRSLIWVKNENEYNQIVENYKVDREYLDKLTDEKFREEYLQFCNKKKQYLFSQAEMIINN
jgi:DNA-directed RNA polymerase subunit RPC12/RpoP